MENEHLLRSRSSNSNSLWVFFVIGLLSLIATLFFSIRTSQSKHVKADYVEKSLHNFHNLSSHQADSLFTLNDTDYFPILVEKTKQENPRSNFYLFENDTLVMWSDNTVHIDGLSAAIQDDDIIELNNGIYYTMRKEKGSQTLIGLLLLKKVYPYRNDFLEEHYNANLKIPENYNLSLNQENPVQIKNSMGDFLFSLTEGSLATPNKTLHYLTIFSFHLLLVGILILLYILYFKYQRLIKNKRLIPFLYSVDVFLILIVINYFRIPGIMFNSGIYQMYLPGDFDFLSIGSLLTNSIVLLSISFAFYDSGRQRLVEMPFNSKQFIRFSFGFISLAILYAVINICIYELIFYSVNSLNLNFNSFFYKPEIVTVFLIICVLILSFFIISFRVYRSSKSNLSITKHRLIFAVFSGL